METPTIETRSVEGVMYKGIGAPASFDEKSGKARFVMSEEREDRHSDIVRVDGIDTKDFEKNPIMLWGHRSWDMPIGKWAELSKTSTGGVKRLEGDAMFVEGTPMADQAKSLVGSGVIQACSIGFRPISYSRVYEEESFKGFDITECELVECSLVAVPANAGALVKALDDGVDPTILKEFAEMVLDCWERTAEGVIVPRKVAEDAKKQLDDATGGTTTMVPVEKASNEITLIEEKGEIVGVRSKEPIKPSLFERLFGKQEKRVEPEPPKAPEPEIIEGSRAKALETLKELQAA